MKTKLTLRLDEGLIQQAKDISSQQGKSVSKMVEDFFSLLVSKSTEQTEQEYTVTVRYLKGMLNNKNVDENDYHKHLEEKYL